jgi:signal transduction histidine kinase
VLGDRSGRRFPAEITVFAGPDDPRHVVCLIDDVSERVRTREELERRVRERTAELEVLNADLARANAAKDEFLGLVSHELKTPITTILAASLVLERRAAVTDRDALLEDLVAEATRLAGIVDNLLALARLDAGRQPEREPVALDRLLPAAIATVEREFPERVIRVTAEPGVIVEANEPQLIMVVRNYLSNALKYSPPDRPVEVVLRKDTAHAFVAVVDSGIGIDDDHAAVLFEPFYRMPAASGIAGMGIGLAVCRRIVESLGGRVHAASRPNEPGSVFTFVLPLADHDPDADVVEAEVAATQRR